MSSNTNTSRYKQVNRQARIQTREGAFSKGMMYTDKPLTEGYSKLLVNYDIDPLDGTLHTRKGLQATEMYPIASEHTALFGMSKGFTNILASNTHALGNVYRNYRTKASEIGTDLIVYNTSTNSLNMVSLADIPISRRTDDSQYNIDHTKEYPYNEPYALQPICSGTEDTYQVLPRTLIEPSVHGQKCAHNLYFKKPIGTFAFGNAYYTFSRHTINAERTEDELHVIRYYNTEDLPQEGRAIHQPDTEKNAEGDLYDFQVVPQQLNPSEAASAGFNMLAPDPYTFACQNGANIDILGVLPYDDAGKDLLLNILVNQDVILKCFYRAPFTAGRQASLKQWGSQYEQYMTYTEWASRNNTYGTSYTLDTETGEVVVSDIIDVTTNTPKKGDVFYWCTPVTNADGTTFYQLNQYTVTVTNVNYNGEPAFGYDQVTYRTVITTVGPWRIKWEWREVGATTWNLIKEDIFAFADLEGNALECPFRSAVEQLILRVTISDTSNKVTQTDGTEIEYVEATTALGLTCYGTNTLFRQNVTPVNYNLATAKGMLEWKNRLVLWGVENAETILFTSDVNNPAYFPYPNNIDILDEPVLHCMLYGDDLVVFTNTKLYRLTIGETGGIGTHTLIQKNLSITERDIPMFCLVKNMLFFKSGNYYYMLVPKSSSITGETTVAPISKAIYPFLDNFSAEVEKLFKIYTQGKTEYANNGAASWKFPFTSFLENYYAYADNTSVVINYVYDYTGFIQGHLALDNVTATVLFKKESNYWPTPDFASDNYKNYVRPILKRQFILSLIYNTESYTWSIKIHETPNIPYPVYHNALGQQYYMYITVQHISGSEDNPVFVQCTKQGTEDSFILYQTSNFWHIYDYTTIANLDGAVEHTYDKRTLQKNHQYLDTGYRMLTGAVDIKKRFREVQFSINNVSQKALTFYTAFIVDGNLRKDMKGYTTKMMVDPDDPRTGVLLVERPYIDERYLPSVPDYVIKVEDYVSPDVTPGDTTLDDTFVLDNTQFPDLAYWKVRVGVSGKGYVPRLQILSVNDKEYSLLSTNWVYRTMNSR